MTEHRTSTNRSVPMFSDTCDETSSHSSTFFSGQKISVFVTGHHHDETMGGNHQPRAQSFSECKLRVGLWEALRIGYQKQSAHPSHLLTIM